MPEQSVAEPVANKKDTEKKVTDPVENKNDAEKEESVAKFIDAAGVANLVTSYQQRTAEIKSGRRKRDKETQVHDERAADHQELLQIKHKLARLYKLNGRRNIWHITSELPQGVLGALFNYIPVLNNISSIQPANFYFRGPGPDHQEYREHEKEGDVALKHYVTDPETKNRKYCALDLLFISLNPTDAVAQLRSNKDVLFECDQILGAGSTGFKLTPGDAISSSYLKAFLIAYHDQEVDTGGPFAHPMMSLKKKFQRRECVLAKASALSDVKKKLEEELNNQLKQLEGKKEQLQAEKDTLETEAKAHEEKIVEYEEKLKSLTQNTDAYQNCSDNLKEHQAQLHKKCSEIQEKNTAISEEEQKITDFKEHKKKQTEALATDIVQAGLGCECEEYTRGVGITKAHEDVKAAITAIRKVSRAIKEYSPSVRLSTSPVTTPSITTNSL